MTAVGREPVMRLPAPAKLNLMLRIVGRRTDGYHLLQTVFQFLDICDWITLTPRADGEIQLVNPLPGVPADEDLTVRAARAIRQASGSRLGVSIQIEKHLPMGGGLGGGSSDAATTLMGLNRLWDAGLEVSQIKALGLSLGADVPVFVEGLAAWGEGVGEDLQPLDLEEPWFAVVVPECHIATGKIFSAPDLTRDNPPIRIQGFFDGNHDNHCLPVVLGMYPEVGVAMKALGQFGVARLTGTGACVFAEFDSKDRAQEAIQSLAPHYRGFVAKGMNRSSLLAALDPFPVN